MLWVRFSAGVLSRGSLFSHGPFFKNKPLSPGFGWIFEKGEVRIATRQPGSERLMLAMI